MAGTKEAKRKPGTIELVSRWASTEEASYPSIEEALAALAPILMRAIRETELKHQAGQVTEEAQDKPA